MFFLSEWVYGKVVASTQNILHKQCSSLGQKDLDRWGHDDDDLEYVYTDTNQSRH